MLWSLLPDQQLYMEFPLDSGNARSRGVGFEGAQTVEHRSLGTEQVGGHRTTKYEVTLRQATGETASGTLWATADMIPVKMDMVLPGGERMLIELKDIEIGPQPDFLFEIPAGYNRISLGALGELAGALESLPGRPRSSAARTDGAEDDPGFGQEVAEEALEGVREGTKRGVRQGVQENVTRRIRGIFRDR